ncbi:MAG: hypothetical protein EBV03_09200 [Proteobacteria bacterium]|nr:hypothetical protein [Pseudomonadota bacterium]
MSSPTLKPLPQADEKTVADLREKVSEPLRAQFDAQCLAMHELASRDGIPTFLGPLMQRYSREIAKLLIASGVPEAAQKSNEILEIYVKHTAHHHRAR